MKTTTFTLLILLLFVGANLSAASAGKKTSGGYGNTLNLGVGIGGYSGYYGYDGHSLPVFSINYEFDVANNFTLAPFVTLASYRNDKYAYRETVIPIGVKGSYYLDDALNAGSDWDFYLAGSLGYSVVNTRWDGANHNEDYHKVRPLFLDLHFGAEYHLSNKVGLFLDLSTGVSTIGLSFR